MPTDLKSWVEPLPEGDRSKAIAAVGLITHADARLLAEPYPLVMQDRISDAIAASDEIRGPLAWRSPATVPGWDPSSVDPALFAEAWPDTWGQRFAIDPDLGGEDLHWVRRTLQSPIVHAGGAFVSLLMRGERPPAPWRFPLRIGTVDRSLYEHLVAEFTSGPDWLQTLLQPVLLGPQGVSCDLLLVVDADAEDLTAVRNITEVRSIVAVVLDDAPRWSLDAVEAIRSACNAEAVAYATPTEPARLIGRLVEELSHDAALEGALSMATESAAGALLAAPSEVVRALRATRRAEALAASVGDRAEVTRGLPDIRPRLDGLTDRLSNLTRGGYVSESGDASELARAEPEAAEALAEVEEERWVQARLHAGRGEERSPVAAFRPATTHEIDVRIGHYEQGWMAAGTPFPVDTLETEGPFDLTVILSEPHLLDEPQRGTITLPLVGASTTATFTLTTKADTSNVDARIIVLHRNRVVQTCKLRGELRSDGGTVGLDEADVAEAEAVVRPSVSGMDDRRTFGMALVVNQNDDGNSRATAIGTDAVGDVNLQDVEGAVGMIRERLGEIVSDEEDFAGLDAPGTVELLVFLAIHGSLLYDALGDFLTEELAAQRYLQIVSAKADAYLPIEFAYEFAPPNSDATLCPDAAQALTDAMFPAGCPGDHDEAVVCPFGFWAVSKVIERQTFQSAEDIPREFQVRSNPTRDRNTITIGASALFAASSKVDAIAAGTIERVTATLRTVTGDNDPFVDSWEAWKTLVASDKRPGLLLIMSHTVRDQDNNIFGLEIGEHDAVFVHQLKKQFVPPQDRPVVVALLGCETAVSGEVPWEQFPGRFRRAGAEIIIGTLTEVLGRHAAVVGEKLVEALYACCADVGATMGEVMVGVRRRLLAGGFPMVLALTVFGDADWLLTKEE